MIYPLITIQSAKFIEEKDWNGILGFRAALAALWQQTVAETKGWCCKLMNPLLGMNLLEPSWLRNHLHICLAAWMMLFTTGPIVVLNCCIRNGTVNCCEEQRILASCGDLLHLLRWNHGSWNSSETCKISSLIGLRLNGKLDWNLDFSSFLWD